MLTKLENEHLNLSIMITAYLTRHNTIYANIFTLVVLFFLSQPASLILFIAANFKELPGDL